MLCSIDVKFPSPFGSSSANYPARGGGGTPLDKPYRNVPPQWVWFLGLFGLKTGIDFAQFGLESGMVFEGTAETYERIYRFNSKWIRKMEICEFEMHLKKFFCLRSNLSNDEIISAERPGLKTGVENDIFGAGIGSGFGEPGGAPHQEFPRSNPHPYWAN